MPRVKTPFGSFKDALITQEWKRTARCPGQKFYVRDIGVVPDVAKGGGSEELVLVDVKLECQTSA